MCLDSRGPRGKYVQYQTDCIFRSQTKVSWGDISRLYKNIQNSFIDSCWEVEATQMFTNRMAYSYVNYWLLQTLHEWYSHAIWHIVVYQYSVEMCKVAQSRYISKPDKSQKFHFEKKVRNKGVHTLRLHLHWTPKTGKTNTIFVLLFLFILLF